MTTQRSNVMHTLVDLATQESKQAAERLSDANKTLRDSEQNLTMLLEYRRDYTLQLTRNLESGVHMGNYQNFQGFLYKLDQAISGQEKLVESCKQNVADQLKQWQACERKKLSYGVIIQHAETKAMHAQQKKEQKLMDEHATRQSMKNAGKSSIR
jgi:flagellar protein FliJ